MDPSNEADPKDARRQLRRAERLLACFQKALGHELPNQLVAIQGLAYLLREEGAERLGAEGQECLERLVAVVERTHALVRELAEVGRAVRQTPAGGKAVLREAVQEVLAEARQLSPGGTIDCDLVDPGKPVPLPDAGLRLVLACLLGHAVRRAAGRPLRVQVGARESAAATEVWLSDDGPALAPAERQQLFEPFAAVPEGGPRLGLFLCSLLVDGWGGTIDVGTAAGGGNRFTIAVPRRTSPPAGES